MDVVTATATDVADFALGDQIGMLWTMWVSRLDRKCGLVEIGQVGPILPVRHSLARRRHRCHRHQHHCRRYLVHDLRLSSLDVAF